MIVTTAQLFKYAYGNYAVGAYNINNAEQAMGLFRGCIQSQAPFIIQISKGARKYTDKRMLEAIIRTAEQIFPDAVFAVHLDHGDEEACYDCIKSGFYSSVMIDASHETFDKNVEITRRVATEAHKKGISVEAELGMLGGVEEDIKVDAGNACLTKPDEAQKFIKLTGCDSLAAAIGTSHGAYKFKGRQSLHFEVIEGVKKLCPGFPIVNIDTDGRLVWTRVHREFFRDKPSEFDFRPPGKIFMDEYAKFIAHKNEKLGSAGQLPLLRKALGK